MAKKTFKKGDYVSATTADTKTAIIGYIDAIETTKGGDNLFQIDGKWYMENAIKHQTPLSWTPTDSQMKSIKKEYPFLKKGNVKIIYECGHDTEDGFVGIFGFIWANGQQNAKVMFKKGEFSPMTDKFAKKYGF